MGVTRVSSKSWTSLAACRDAEVDFFTKDPRERDVAKLVCVECPVRRVCLEYALAVKATYGVWGGVDEGELKRARSVDSNGKLRRLRRAPRCPNCKNRKILRDGKHLDCTTCDLKWTLG